MRRLQNFEAVIIAAIMFIFILFFVLAGVHIILSGFVIFGAVWLLFVLGIAAVFVVGFIKGKKVANKTVTEEITENEGDTEARLARLRELYDRRMLTTEEYESQRAEIIKKI